MLKSVSTTFALTDFRIEKNNLLREVKIKTGARLIRPVNYDIHDNYEIDDAMIALRLEAITTKFRKCEVIHNLYFDGIHHGVLTHDPRDLPINRECIFTDGFASSRHYFDVNDRVLYQEMIDCQFQEFILFCSMVLENLVYLSETLIRKIVVHLKGKHPPSIQMHNFTKLLEVLIDLGYRQPDQLHSCLHHHQVFLKRFLPTISVLRNVYAHGYTTRLKSNGAEYIIAKPSDPLTINSPEVTVDIFTKSIVDNLRLLISDFFIAISSTIAAAPHIPA